MTIRKPMKALILAPFDPSCLDELRARMEAIHESWLESRRLYSPEELTARLNDEKIAILVVEADFVLEETFQQAPGLRFLGICRNATTHIDVDVATEKGVVVVNAPGRNALAVAELVLGLMFSLARKIPACHNYVTSGSWEDPVSPYLELRGTELEGKTLGIVGLGGIGSEVARKSRALGLEVIAYDPYLPSGRREVCDVRMVDLDELLGRSDFVSLHVSPGPESAGVIGSEGLERMKPSAFLINTSSPQAVDQGALEEALEKGRIAGAALDVHEASPLPPGHPLLKMDNVILTPHIGGATDGTVKRHSRMMIEDIECFLAGRRPPRIVNPLVWGHRA